MTVEWRPVVGYEGIYEVSSDGRVRSLARLGVRGQRVPARDLKARIGNKHGYLVVGLSRNREHATVLVHRLACRAFHGEPAPGHQVRHLDGEKYNNSASNLRWGTRSENQLDIVVHGRHQNALKTHCPRGHAYTPENTLPTGARGRGCRECANARRRLPAPAGRRPWGLPDNPDRRVHVRTRDGREVVRYSRSGKWWIEYPGRSRRFFLSFPEAVSWASDTGAAVFLGLPGGRYFDLAVRRDKGVAA